jgi:hypothetical protein
MEKSQGRHELKHYINFADVIELRSRLPYVAKPDRNCREGNGYRIKSLSFDNYNDKALPEKIWIVPNCSSCRLGRLLFLKYDDSCNHKGGADKFAPFKACFFGTEKTEKFYKA